jgi:vacuolar protein sorting-associated protein 13A/C
MIFFSFPKLSESLNVAVWAGKIELNSLKLDVEAVNRELARQAAEAPNLAIPFRVVSGSFKHLCVDVPWARITSRPVVMRLEGLDAIVEPYDHLAAKYGRSANTSESKLYGLREEEQSASTEPKLYGYHDEEHSASTTTPSKKKKKKNKGDERMITVSLAEEGRQRAITMKQLADIETEGPLSGFEVDKSEQKRSSSKGFKARLVRRIIENLQVDIDGVKLEMRGKGCIAGILLDHFSIVTTDKYGNRNFVDRATNSCDVEKSFIYKVLQLQGLGIYCDEENNYSKQKAGSNNYMPLEINARGERNFILSPFSFEAKLRQSDCLKCIDFPKYHLSTKLPSVEIQLSRTQLEMVNKISRDLAAKQHVSRPLFPEYRPEEPLNGKNAKLWWKYALRAVGRITRKRSWTEFYIAFEKRKTYIPLYKRSVSRNCSWIIPLNEEEELMMKNIEMDKTIGVQGLMSWRSIAEGQIDLERKKYEAKEAVRNNAKSTPKKRFGLFGSKAYESSDDLGHLSDDDDDSPITLSISEMKDLEKIGREEHEVDNELTSDSILCDVNFHLGSFGIELTTFASRPLASFQMGTLSSSFKANNDGSFVSDFQMSSFNISDRITCNTLFPYVVRSLEHPKSSNQTDELQHAFGFKLTKAKNGDQSLDARLVSFEIIACDVFIKECKRFVTFSHEDFSSNTAKNPTLEFSVSGGADLFYDANDPMMTLNAPSINGSDIFDYRSHSNRSKVSDKVATAFNDAWKSKLERKIAWQIQLDVRAPVIVLPQTCVDPMATVLVADLGNFLFEYGGRKVEKDVRKWFESDGVEEDVSIDRCSLQLNDFTFLIGKAGNKDWLKSDATDLPSKIKSEAIIEPTNFGIDIGIENGGGQRICLFGVLPSISLKIAYSQIERILSVISFWSNLAKYISNSEDNLLISSASDEIDEEDQDEAVDNDIERNVNKDEELKKGGSGDKFLSFALQKLSLQITNDEDESIETHFISVETTYRQSSDGLTSVRMRMGCFWILDHLNSTFVREQRLFAHSTLPKSASFYAKNGYEILRDLEEEGVFEDSTKINSLADVTLTNAPCIANSLKDVSIIADHARNYPVTKIDAEFSTLLIHW